MSNNIRIPNDFWKKERPYVTNEESLKDIIPINWDKSDNEDIIVYSVKEKDMDYPKEK